jgi:hypothetical protein
MLQQDDYFPIITAPQSDSCSMDMDELLPIERQQLLKEEESLMPRPTKQGVSFSKKNFINRIESSEEWSDDERNNTWFSTSELEHFKGNARKLCQREAKKDFISPEESTRGMSVYFSSRKRRHAQHVFHVLRAYYEQFPGNSEYVAHLSEKWSDANRTRAFRTGIRDMYEAYFPHLIEQTQFSSHPYTLSSATFALSPNLWQRRH